MTATYKSTPASTRKRRSSTSLNSVLPIPREVYRTVTWQELPEWREDNEYIISGYRRQQNQWKGCFVSVFAYLHNETVNIHSHLWAALLFMYFLVTLDVTNSHPGTWKDSGVFSIFLFSAILCLSGSALYHTVTCHSEKVSSRCHALDYSGIVILIVGSFYPAIYYGFYCNPHLQLLYIMLITFAGLGAAYIVLNPEYAKPTHRKARTTVFICLGLSGFIPGPHMLLANGFKQLFVEMGFAWVLASGALYIFGALLYANRIPERFSPGRFDYFLASHQIFHFCVVLAALAHYCGMLKAFEVRLSRGCEL